MCISKFVSAELDELFRKSSSKPKNFVSLLRAKFFNFSSTTRRRILTKTKFAIIFTIYENFAFPNVGRPKFYPRLVFRNLIVTMLQTFPNLVFECRCPHFPRKSTVFSLFLQYPTSPSNQMDFRLNLRKLPQQKNEGQFSSTLFFSAP